MNCRSQSAPPAPCCSTCATRRNRHCRTSARCGSRSAPTASGWMRPRAATWSSIPACRATTPRLCSRCWTAASRPWARARCGAGSTVRSAAQPVLRQRYHAVGDTRGLARATRRCARACATSVIWSASWRASRCARRDRATWCSCAPRWRRHPGCAARAGRVRFAAARRAAAQHIGEHAAEHGLLQRAIAAEPAQLLRDGGVIAAGYDAALDELRAISGDTDDFLLELERRERERTGIANLKLGYNRVQGFYIEVSRVQAERVPADYLRRQTVKSAERFITPELKGFEDKVLGARERALARERELYDAAADGADRGAAGAARQRRCDRDAGCAGGAGSARGHSAAGASQP